MSITRSLVDIIKQTFTLHLTQALTEELNSITNQISDLTPMYNREIKSAFSLQWPKENQQVITANIPVVAWLSDSFRFKPRSCTIKPICSKISCRSNLNYSFATIGSCFQWYCAMTVWNGTDSQEKEIKTWKI